MLSRILSRSNLRLISSTFSSHIHPPSSNFSKTPKFPFFPHHRNFSNNNGDESDFWKINSKNDDLDDIFGTHDPQLTPNQQPQKNWVLGETHDGGVGVGGGGGDFLSALERGGADVSDAGAAANATGFTPWSLPREEDDGRDEDVFGVIGGGGGGGGVIGGEEDEKSKEEREFIDEAQKSQLRNEQQSLMEVIQGPDRAFGDLIAASGITDAMLDSLIALKNFEDVEGLPPLTQIEDSRYAKTLKKSSRYEIEIQKQEDAAKARVRKVDEKGRAYGTGKRKCSIARVWIQPGEGKFCINDKEFDVYFPMLDHRAALLSPFSETKTVGLWDVKCTVKGGGTTGQVDAIRLGISRALQNWEPGLRPPLRDAGFLTRDPRVVERKKPGKAKARKSFQWVKR